MQGDKNSSAISASGQQKVRQYFNEKVHSASDSDQQSRLEIQSEAVALISKKIVCRPEKLSDYQRSGT